MDKQVKPNLFICGSAKSGTTSLWAYLKEHPKVFMPKDEINKEPGFFSQAANPYHSRLDEEQYLSLFKEATPDHKFIGEASNIYLTDPASAEMIHQFNPASYIIILLRNPADRAYSLYNWMAQEGYEYASSFEKALKIEKKRINKKIPNFFEPEKYYNYLYFHSGLYHEQVKRYLDLFPSTTMIIKFEDFKLHPQKKYDEVCQFLNIESQTVPSRVFNPSFDIYSPKLQFCLRKLSTVLDLIKRRIYPNSKPSKSKRDKIMKLGYKNASPPRINPQTRSWLLQRYKENILATSELTHLNLDDWLE